MSQTPLPSENQLISFPLRHIIADLIGENGCVCVSDVTARIIHAVCQNQILCHVQFIDDKDIDVYLALGAKIPKSPVLWEIGYWRSSCDRWLLTKKFYEEQRKARYIEDENIRRVMKRVRVKYPAFNETMQRTLALSLLKDNNPDAFKFFGIGKLAATVEEI